MNFDVYYPFGMDQLHCIVRNMFPFNIDALIENGAHIRYFHTVGQSDRKGQKEELTLLNHQRSY